MTRVSVIIPTYNRAALVARAVHCVLNQTIGNVEVLVVDDCSSDQTPAVLEWMRASLPWADERLRYVRLPRNMGANAARNRGIDEARGEYIAFLDSDDLWHPSKLERQLARIEEGRPDNTGARPCFCFTGRLRVDDDYRVIARQFPRTARGAVRQIRVVNSIGTLSSVLMTTWAARFVGGFNEALFACQDWDFFCRAVPLCQVLGVAEPMVMYFDGSISRVTLDHRRRLKSHLWMYRNYMQGEIPEVRLGEFYRNIAEDLEGLGKVKLARRFGSLGKWLSGSYVRAIRLGLTSSAPGLKAERYAKYEANTRCQVNEVAREMRPFEASLLFGRQVEALLSTGRLETSCDLPLSDAG